jgi:hypothetical protein
MNKEWSFPDFAIMKDLWSQATAECAWLKSKKVRNQLQLVLGK